MTFFKKIHTFAVSKEDTMDRLSLDHIYRASHVLKTVIRQTNLIKTTVNGEEIYLKPENLQVTGSFKVRGAGYMISQLSKEEREKGVIACSAGNHAQGVALAARSCGIPATICLPAGAPISKVEATRSYGAEICLVPGVYDDAYAYALRLKEERGLAFVHPFDDPLVIAGQGTIGLEILDELPDVDQVVVPIGGGGLASGVAYAIKQLNPGTKVFGVQAEGASSMFNSVHDGMIETLDRVHTIADGIAVKQPGELTYSICKDMLDGIVTVTEDEICTAILHLMENRKVISEGAGAVSVAAVLFGKIPCGGKKTVCIVSGGNIDVNFLNRIVSRGLEKSGRKFTLAIEMPDKPGELVTISKVIAELGANITAVHHERTASTTDVTSCVLRVAMETRNLQHCEQIQKELVALGYKMTDF